MRHPDLPLDKSKKGAGVELHTRQLCLGQMLGFHFLADLPSDDALEGDGSGLLKHGLFVQEIIKTAPMWALFMFAFDPAYQLSVVDFCGNRVLLQR